eukprot:3233948-Rhodomonas_salina.1
MAVVGVVGALVLLVVVHLLHLRLRQGCRIDAHIVHERGSGVVESGGGGVSRECAGARERDVLQPALNRGNWIGQ